MFGPAGHSYVFLIYGLHFHFNLVAGAVDEPHAVLIRAVEPIAGTELMTRRRRVPAAQVRLTNGPGKLCQAFAIGRSEYGVDLCKSTTLYLVDGAPPTRVGRATRIGVDYSGAWAEKQWRFYAVGDRYVSHHPTGKSL
jgi:DNA-3-methyladenine glycosylase